MTDEDVSDDVRQLLHTRLASMDHVEVLLQLYAADQESRDLQMLTQATRLPERVVTPVLADLIEARLVGRTDTGYKFEATPTDRDTIAALTTLYHTRPVTLVRVIYSRPASIASFTQALRTRKDQ